MTESPRYRKVTKEQFQKGWIELRGVTPIHHSYKLVEIEERDGYDPVYIVMEPTIHEPDPARRRF